MEQTPATGPRSRLTDLPSTQIKPFIRAEAVEEFSVYWIPVWEYPMLPFQRTWLREFHRRLASHLASESGLRQECFLQFKVLYPHLLEEFTATSGDFLPMSGMGLAPGVAPTAVPAFKEIKQQVEESSKSGEAVDTGRWMPDYLHWFLSKRPELQRDAFFGQGGMLTLYLQPDPKAEAPLLDLPRVITSHPAYTPAMQDEVQAMYSLQDGFLKRSKELFGGPLRDDPNFKGLLFILPLLSGRAVVNATSDERAQWFELFSGYLIESKSENGMLLLLKQADFDVQLAGILRSMEDDGFVYGH